MVSFNHTNGVKGGCEHCGCKVSTYSHGCPGCGAPVCCQRCCDEANEQMKGDAEYKSWRPKAAQAPSVSEAWVTQALQLINAFGVARGSQIEPSCEAVVAHIRTPNVGVKGDDDV